jgi:peptidoglycan/LPS O-acetylase OafA/YrhL
MSLAIFAFSFVSFETLPLLPVWKNGIEVYIPSVTEIQSAEYLSIGFLGIGLFSIILAFILENQDQVIILTRHFVTNFVSWFLQHEELIILSAFIATIGVSIILAGLATYSYGRMIHSVNYSIFLIRNSCYDSSLNMSSEVYICPNSSGGLTSYTINVNGILGLGTAYPNYLFQSLEGFVVAGIICCFLKTNSWPFYGKSLVGSIAASIAKGFAAMPKAESGFNPSLSGLRGLAALGVAIFHVTQSLPYFPLGAITGTLFIGVPIFFMLSMFLLLTSLEKNYDLKRYFKRRITRIWPIYYGCLLIFYLLGILGPFSLLVRYATFTQYFLAPYQVVGAASIFWTLQVEEVAYVLIPIISKLALRNKRILAAIMIIIGGYSMFANPYDTIDATIRVVIPASLFSYGLGLLAYTTSLHPKLRYLAPAGLLLLVFQNLSNLDILIEVGLGFYCVTILGFAAIVKNPPPLLGKFTLMGETSYAYYALHHAFEMFFGVFGIVLTMPVAFAVEFRLRRKEITKRLGIAYLSHSGSHSELRSKDLVARYFLGKLVNDPPKCSSVE